MYLMLAKRGFVDHAKFTYPGGDPRIPGSVRVHAASHTGRLTVVTSTCACTRTARRGCDPGPRRTALVPPPPSCPCLHCPRLGLGRRHSVTLIPVCLARIRGHYLHLSLRVTTTLLSCSGVFRLRSRGLHRNPWLDYYYDNEVGVVCDATLVLSKRKPPSRR